MSFRSHTSLAPSNTFAGDEQLHGSRRSLSSHITAHTAGTELANLPVDLHLGEPQLTVKGCIAGVISGCICTVLALYYGLKTGTIPSLNILGAVLGYILAKAMLATGLFGTTFTPQENAIIQTLSVAVYSVATPGFGLATGYLGLSKNAWKGIGGDEMEGNSESDTIELNYWRTLVWCLALFPFGLFLAFPLRKYYLLKKKLMFPSGTATAYIVSNLHAGGGKSRRLLRIITKWFSFSLAFNLVGWVFSGLAEVPIFGPGAGEFGWTLDFDVGSYGIGAVLPFMCNFSMVVGGVIIYGLAQPLIQKYRDGDFDGAWFDSATLSSPYLGLYSYALFSGLAIMIVQGVWSICVLGVTLFRSWRHDRNGEDVDAGPPGVVGAGDIEEGASSFGPSKGVSYYRNLDHDPRYEMFESVNIPWWVGVGGYVISSAFCIVVLHFLVDSTWYQTLCAIIVVPILAVSNIEGMGRTDWDVSSAYGKVIMFPIGAWNRGKSIIPAVSICHTTISGCSNSALLMQDFKTGLLLGANAIHMVISQFAGLLIGCLIGPAVLSLFTSAFEIPNSDPSSFIQGKFAFIYRTLAVVATGDGFNSLPDGALYFMLGFAILALVMDVIELFLPERAMKYWPDISSVSLGMLVGPAVPVEFFLGWFFVWLWSLKDPVKAENQKYYVASGCVAGSGIGAVLLCLLSLCGIDPPMTVTWSPQDQSNQFGAGRWIMTLVCIGILVACIFFAGFYWHDVDSDEELDGMTDADSSFAAPVQRKTESQVSH